MKSTIVVVFGGESVEHDISIITAIQALNAIDKQKYNVVPLYIDKVGRWLTSSNFFSMDSFLKEQKSGKRTKEISFMNGSKHMYLKTKIGLKKWHKVSVAFLCCHGGIGENGAIQGFFEVLGIPITSPNHISSAICMDKVVCKKILKESEIPVIDYTVLTQKEYGLGFNFCYNKVFDKLNLPVILKPSKLGSSVGITVCKNKKQLKQGLELGFKFDESILVEKLITEIKEVNVSVLRSSAWCYLSKTESPNMKKDFLTFEDKYLLGNKKTASDNKRIIPADIEKDMENKIFKIAKDACEILNINGLIRIDFIIDKKEDKIYLNEINTIPGSLANYLWKGKFDFKTLIDKMIEGAMVECEEEKKLLKSFSSSVLTLNSFGKKSKI